MAHSADQRPHPSALSRAASTTLADRVSPTSSRVLHAALGLGYLVVYWSVYADYLSITWGYSGLIFRPMAFWEIAFAAVGVTAVAFSLPSRLRGPSSLILWLLFAFVYVPTMAQTFMIGQRESEVYVSALSALTASMLGVSWFIQSFRLTSSRRTFVPSRTFALGLVLASVSISLLLLWYYRTVLTLSDITNSDDVYAARFAAADMTGSLIGYVRTYLSYVVGPATLAVALVVSRYRWFIVPGLACFLVGYIIDGSKISLVTPLAMFLIYGLIHWARSSVLVMTGSIAALTWASGLFAGHSPMLRFIADLILFRSIAIPGQQFALYYDLFASRGFTWWSSIRGLNLIVPPPAYFASDPRWPVLGQIVGEEYFGFSSRTNSNANLFAGEGVAAAGPLGVLVIAVFLAAYLRILDRAANGWDPAFVLLVIVPIGLALTNVHLSTMLVSFGGAFWVLALVVFRPSGTKRLEPKH